MSILSRKYPFQPSSSWMVESLRNCAVVFLILYFLQPFGFSAYEGNKLLASFLFGAVTFLCCLAFRFLVFIPLQKHVRPWRIWHEALKRKKIIAFGHLITVKLSFLCDLHSFTGNSGRSSLGLCFSIVCIYSPENYAQS